MAVNLRDAKITVKLDLKDGEKAVSSLEKRTVKQRKIGELEERKRKKELKKSEVQARRRPSLAGRVAGTVLYQTVVNIVRSIPLGIGLVAGIGIAKLDLLERFGPGLEEFIDRFLRDRGIPVPDIILASKLAREVGDLKSALASITTGFEAAKQRASADIIGGGTVTADEFAQMFVLERRFAEFSRNLQRAESRARGQLIGGGIAQSLLADELEKATSGSLNK